MKCRGVHLMRFCASLFNFSWIFLLILSIFYVFSATGFTLVLNLGAFRLGLFFKVEKNANCIYNYIGDF